MFIFLKQISFVVRYIDASYEEKHCSRGAGRRKAQLATRRRRVAQLKISDEEKHDSDARTTAIYWILINSTPITNSKNKNC